MSLLLQRPYKPPPQNFSRLFLAEKQLPGLGSESRAHEHFQTQTVPAVFNRDLLVEGIVLIQSGEVFCECDSLTAEPALPYFASAAFIALVVNSQNPEQGSHRQCLYLPLCIFCPSRP